MPAGILWSGHSPHDSAPIVAIATDGSRNVKTGPMIQVWILRTDIPPHEAVRSGDDAAVCGTCPHRLLQGRRSCYVRVEQAPLSVWHRYRRGGYRDLHVRELEGRDVRLGAYGDPAMLPAWLVWVIRDHARTYTAYTHQWRRVWARAHRGAMAASVDSAREEREARDLGWGTFRVGVPDGSDRGTTPECPSLSGAQCVTCGACDGGQRSIYIPAHGAGAAYVPAERLRKKVRLEMSQ